MAAGLLLSGGLALLYGFWLTHQPVSMPRSLVKTAAVGVLAAMAAGSGAPVLLTVALALGAAGDFWLSRQGQKAFLAGLVCFAAAHLALIARFWPDRFVWTALSLLPLAAAAVLGGMIVPRAQALAVPVAIYCGIIATMAVVAMQPTQTGLVQTGAALFVVSDACLGLSLFVLAPRHGAQKTIQLVIWFTYWAAQLLFVAEFVPLWPR